CQREWRLRTPPAVILGGLVVLGLTTRPMALAALTGAVVCFAGLGIPNNGGVLIGATAGVIVGFLADKASAASATDRAATARAATDRAATDRSATDGSGGGA